MNLAIFDIDGTLTNTAEVDSQAYFDALEDLFSIRLHGVDLRQFKYSSDLGILNEIFSKTFARLPGADEVERFKNRFLTALTLSSERAPSEFREIPGANSFLQMLQRNSEWFVAIATGCFYDSAALKLRLAEFPYESIPIATCDDHIERIGVIQRALQKSVEHYDVVEFNNTVYLGDGVWDVHAAKALDLPFLAVGRRVPELLGAGAQGGVRDFADSETAFMALKKARPPGAHTAHKRTP